MLIYPWWKNWTIENYSVIKQHNDVQRKPDRARCLYYKLEPGADYKDDCAKDDAGKK